MSIQEALNYAKLVDIAGTCEGKYGQAQWDAAEVLGYQIIEVLWGVAFEEQTSFGYVAKGIGCPNPDVCPCGSQDETVIALRGTDPAKIKEWLADASIEKVPSPFGPGKIHKGFLEVYQSLTKYSIPDSSQNIVVCGHSLGGAIATLLISEVDNVLDKSSICPVAYTFGSPRVGDEDFVLWYNLTLEEDTFRYKNELDPITDLPLGYQHVGQEIKLKKIVDWDEQHFLSSYIKNLEGQL
jgi:Lipase (class 3)